MVDSQFYNQKVTEVRAIIAISKYIFIYIDFKLGLKVVWVQ